LSELNKVKDIGRILNQEEIPTTNNTYIMLNCSIMQTLAHTSTHAVTHTHTHTHTHRKKEQENMELYWFESHFLCNPYLEFPQGWSWILFRGLIVLDSDSVFSHNVIFPLFGLSLSVKALL